MKGESLLCILIGIKYFWFIAHISGNRFRSIKVNVHSVKLAFVAVAGSPQPQFMTQSKICSPRYR